VILVIGIEMTQLTQVFFSFVVQVTLRGPIDPQTGMVANITNLKNCLQQAILEPLDHRNLVSYMLNY
jgi:6-pyruvoyl-tetrahydropterin synthase